MKCPNQNCDATDIENDDNFCCKCGHYTAKGYIYFSNLENQYLILNGEAIKKDNRLNSLLFIGVLGFVLFFAFTYISGNDIFRSFYYIRKQVESYVYGYNTAVIRTDNTYSKKEVSTIEDARNLIYEDLDRQNWKCSEFLNTFNLETDLESNHDIVKVSLCDVTYNETEKISNVINKMYNLFPNIKGALTNISITNAKTQEEYIAYFQPMFQFVNPNEDINNYNKVNKTQILLNSYYFLNENILNNPVENVVGEGWYVKDATWESTIAHELGHYISFVIFLRENGLDNITLVTSENESKINDVLNKFDSGTFSRSIISSALNNYNNKYKTNIDLNTFALSISKYAGAKDKDGDLIADETIAEAIHDYYLHGSNCSKSSFEIVQIIKSRL